VYGLVLPVPLKARPASTLNVGQARNKIRLHLGTCYAELSGPGFDNRGVDGPLTLHSSRRVRPRIRTHKNATIRVAIVGTVVFFAVALAL
jgi:hypothetical protein